MTTTSWTRTPSLYGRVERRRIRTRPKFKIGNNDDGWANSGIQYRRCWIRPSSRWVVTRRISAGTKYSKFAGRERTRPGQCQKVEIHPIPEGKKKPRSR